MWVWAWVCGYGVCAFSCTHSRLCRSRLRQCARIQIRGSGATTSCSRSCRCSIPTESYASPLHPLPSFLPPAGSAPPLEYRLVPDMQVQYLPVPSVPCSARSDRAVQATVRCAGPRQLPLLVSRAGPQPPVGAPVTQVAPEHLPHVRDRCQLIHIYACGRGRARARACVCVSRMQPDASSRYHKQTRSSAALMRRRSAFRRSAARVPSHATRHVACAARR